MKLRFFFFSADDGFGSSLLYLSLRLVTYSRRTRRIHSVRRSGVFGGGEGCLDQGQWETTRITPTRVPDPRIFYRRSRLRTGRSYPIPLDVIVVWDSLVDPLSLVPPPPYTLGFQFRLHWMVLELVKNTPGVLFMRILALRRGTPSRPRWKVPTPSLLSSCPTTNRIYWKLQERPHTTSSEVRPSNFSRYHLHKCGILHRSYWLVPGPEIWVGERVDHLLIDLGRVEPLVTTQYSSTVYSGRLLRCRCSLQVKWVLPCLRGSKSLGRFRCLHTSVLLLRLRVWVLVRYRGL